MTIEWWGSACPACGAPLVIVTSPDTFILLCITCDGEEVDAVAARV